MIVAASNLVHYQGSGVLPNLLMIPVFVVAVGMLTLLSRMNWCQAMTTRSRTRFFLMLQVLLLSGFAAMGIIFTKGAGFPLNNSVDVVPVAMAGVIALSISNALTRIAGSSSLPTTIMTGNLTQAAVSMFTVLSLWNRRSDTTWSKERAALKALGPGIGGFFIGAASAAPLTHHFQFWCLALPEVVLLATIPFAGSLPAQQHN